MKEGEDNSPLVFVRVFFVGFYCLVGLREGYDGLLVFS